VFELLKTNVDSHTFNQIIQMYNESKFIPYSDSANAVRKVKEMNLKTAIATTTPKCWFVQDIPEIISEIDFVCTGFEAGCDKSNPRIFEAIFKELNIKPEEVVVIGDNPKLDVENSSKYGCTTILLRREGDFPDTDLPDYKVMSLTEAVNIIEELLENGAPAGI
jgi:FMN phosphatase YigB (HAD superfamily)